ncbi:MAG TPA: hypothetical protein VIJ33_08395 [Solirubrobacteraceae bacterium]
MARVAQMLGQLLHERALHQPAGQLPQCGRLNGVALSVAQLLGDGPLPGRPARRPPRPSSIRLPPARLASFRTRSLIRLTA